MSPLVSALQSSRPHWNRLEMTIYWRTYKWNHGGDNFGHILQAQRTRHFTISKLFANCEITETQKLDVLVVDGVVLV